jgi:hypothetical protein
VWKPWRACIALLAQGRHDPLWLDEITGSHLCWGTCPPGAPARGRAAR